MIKREGKFIWKHHRRLLHKLKEIRLICRGTNNAKSTHKLFIFNNPMTPKNMHTYHFIIFNMFQQYNIHLRIKMKFVPKNLRIRTTEKCIKTGMSTNMKIVTSKKISTVYVYCFGNNAKKRTTILFM